MTISGGSRPINSLLLMIIVVSLMKFFASAIESENFPQRQKDALTKHEQYYNKSSSDGETGMISSPRDLRQRREIPEAMLDPYSVLGVLSFGVYIFYILYTRYRMRGHHSPTPAAQQQQQQQPQQQQPNGGQLFSVDAQENFANILKMATNIITNAPYLGLTNGTLDSEDYFDDGADLRSRGGRRR